MTTDVAQPPAVADDGPAAKKPKLDAAAEAAPADAAAVAEDATGDGATDAPAPAAAAPRDEPVQIGYKRFATGADAAKYFYTIINSVTHGQELNEYEFHNVVALLKAGHPDAARKLGPGVRAAAVRPHAVEGSPCFHLLRVDGTAEDFSTKKCVAALFPAYAAAVAAKPPRPGRGWKGGAAKGGRGGGGRGRGRGGGGRGRGRGRK